jgi:hypothetical protein
LSTAIEDRLAPGEKQPVEEVRGQIAVVKRAQLCNLTSNL